MQLRPRDSRPGMTPYMTPTTCEDADLVARLAAGDRGEPLERLIDRFGGALFGFGVKLLGDREMAQELVQDTFVRLWRNAGRFDPAQGSVRTFIYAIARNRAIDLRRRRSSRPDHGAPDPLEEQAAEAGFQEALIEGIEVREALGGLGDKHRRVLELSYDEGLTQVEIAERLEIPLGTVKTRTFHALKAMRGELEKRGFDG